MIKNCTYISEKNSNWLYIYIANSRVGAITRVLGNLVLGWFKICNMTGIMNAIVFPEPVFAKLIISSPLSAYGMAMDYMGVGFE